MNEQTKRRLVNNEQLAREKNEAATKGLKKYFRKDKSLQSTPVSFECECADSACKETILISIQDYEKKHKKRNEFVVVPGHNVPTIENVVAESIHYDTVKKPSLKS